MPRQPPRRARRFVSSAVSQRSALLAARGRHCGPPRRRPEIVRHRWVCWLKIGCVPGHPGAPGRHVGLGTFVAGLPRGLRPHAQPRRDPPIVGARDRGAGAHGQPSGAVLRRRRVRVPQAGMADAQFVIALCRRAFGRPGDAQGAASGPNTWRLAPRSQRLGRGSTRPGRAARPANGSPLAGCTCRAWAEPDRGGAPTEGAAPVVKENHPASPPFEPTLRSLKNP